MVERKGKPVLEEPSSPGYTPQGFNIGLWLSSLLEGDDEFSSKDATEQEPHGLLMSIQRLRQRRADRKAAKQRSQKP